MPVTREPAANLEDQFAKLIRSAMRFAMPVAQEVMAQGAVSSACISSLLVLYKGLARYEIWALKYKQGGFVVMLAAVYKRKADAAIAANFHEVEEKLASKAKKEALKLCEKAGLQKLATVIKKKGGQNLELFFSAKTLSV
ncbi:hypothetical protein HPB52_007361 [Rhipicephalus sanguineus]|uniref:Uncharacterized protein n=1 Tax=Rhipicephalus sanguineus TaxID=34632 RepID=A0A9D4T7D9_RHISA|nr:hypothetical protein HPB52_007361 [Rhipicephalus sanguineus]